MVWWYDGGDGPIQTKMFPLLSAKDVSLESTQNERVAIIVNHRSDPDRATTSSSGDERQNPKKTAALEAWEKQQARVRPTKRVRICNVQQECIGHGCNGEN